MKGAIYYVAIAKVIFSHVKITSFRAKAHLVFHWCLYNNNVYLQSYCLFSRFHIYLFIFLQSQQYLRYQQQFQEQNDLLIRVS